MIRRAEAADADFIVELLGHGDIEPFLSARRAREGADVVAQIERSQREPHAFGVFVIEDDGERAGLMEFETNNERSRIAYLGGLAVHPDFRGRRLADEAAREFQRHLLLDLGFHRLQLEIYGFNERAVQHAERVGFVHEGTKRKAYRRHGEWHDGVMFGLVREDLGLPPGVDLLYEYVARHNQGVRTGDWEALGECLADDAALEFEGAAVGPLVGRDAIVAAYRDRPPDDAVRLVEAQETDAGAAATYAWARTPDDPGGTIGLTRADGLVAALTVMVAG